MIAKSNVESENLPPLIETRPFWKKRRYLVTLMSFLGFINIYTQRINLSVAIVQMTEIRNVTSPNGTVIQEQYFDWSTQQQGLVLSSFFYGYIGTQLIGGFIASRIGGNIVMGLGIFATSILTLFSPLAAHGGVGTFVGLRVLMGLTEGVTFPCLPELCSKWAPPLERSRMVAMAWAGTYAGMVIAMSSCGVLTEKLGWESVFYVFGAIGCVWYVFWTWLVYASPEKDPHISEEEKHYIFESLKRSMEPTKPKNIPWAAIFTSTAVWAIAVSHFAENWGVYTLLTQLPLFLKHNLDFDLANSGFIAAIPYLVLGIMLFLVGNIADRIEKRGYLTATQVRKYFNCGAFISQTVFIMLAAYQKDRVLIILFITIGAALGAFSICGYGVNFLDIAPQYASILMGISNTVATIPGIISPLIAGFIVTEQDNPSQWKWIFIMTSCVYMVGCIVYWFFMKATLEPWAQNTEESQEMNEKEKQNSL